MKQRRGNNKKYITAANTTLRMGTHIFQQIDCTTARTPSALQPTWSAMLSTPISQTQPGRSSFMRIKLRGILRCATGSTFQTTPIAGCKEKRGLDLSLLLSASYVWSCDTGYGGAGPPRGVAVSPPSGEMATSYGKNG